MENKMSLAKEALIGPAGDVLGIPSAIGYFIGKRKGKNMAEEGAERPKLGPRSAAGFLFVPGATGYMIGKRVGYDEKKEEAAKKSSEEKKASLAKSAADLVPENIDWSFWRDMPQGRGPVVESFGRRVLGEDRVSVPRIEQAVSYAQSQGYPDGAIAEIRNQGNLAFALEAIHAVAPR